jgi:hypothetical protein
MRIAPLKIALAPVFLVSLSLGAWALFFHQPIPSERSQSIGFEGPTRTSYPDSPRLISSSKYDHTIGIFALYCLLFSSIGEQNQPWPHVPPSKRETIASDAVHRPHFHNP